MSINKVMISGNTTRDAELRATSTGNSVLTFGVAVNDRRRNANGEWEDYANFVDCQLFGRRAEALAQYLTKGTKVAIEGRLHYSSWEDRNGGGRRSKIDVYVDELEFLSSRNGGGKGGNDAPAASAGTVQNQFPGADITYADVPGAYNDEDIPF